MKLSRRGWFGTIGAAFGGTAVAAAAEARTFAGSGLRVADNRLPANSVRSFPLAAIGTPLSTDCTNAQILPRTATGAAAYNGVTLKTTSDGQAWWGIRMQVTNPAAGTDGNFWYSIFAARMVDQFGIAAPAEHGGIVTEHQGPLADQFGAVNLVTDVDWWAYPPIGSAYHFLRVEVRVYSRSLAFTVQNCWTGTPPNSGIAYHGTYCDIDIGPTPTGAYDKAIADAVARALQQQSSPALQTILGHQGYRWR